MMDIDIVITRVSGGVVYARRLRAEGERRHPEIEWVHLEESDYRPHAGEVDRISESDYARCKVLA